LSGYFFFAIYLEPSNPGFINPFFGRRSNMPTVMPEGGAVRKAVQWVSKTREEGAKAPLAALIEQASIRFNLSPKDCDFLNRFFSAQQASESKKE
jgi:hypothetical protein